MHKKEHGAGLAVGAPTAEVSPTLAAIRASMKSTGRSLVAHHRKMLRKHWPHLYPPRPKPAASAPRATAPAAPTRRLTGWTMLRLGRQPGENP